MNDPMRFAGTSMLQVLPKSLVIAANALVREAKTLNSATDTARGSTRDELADLMLTHARTLGLHAESREASASDRAQADALRDALMHEHARIVALPGPKPEKTTYYTDPSIDPRTQAAYTNRAPRRKETEMDDERGTLWDALKRALKSNPTREKADFGPGIRATSSVRTLADLQRKFSDLSQAANFAAEMRNVKKLEIQIDGLGRLQEKVSAEMSYAQNLGEKKFAADLQALADKIEGRLDLLDNNLSNMDEGRGSSYLKEAREKAYNYAPGQIANRTVAQAESDVAHAIDACYNAGKNLKRLEEAISRLEDVLKNIDEASSLARRKSDVPTLRALEAIYNKGELEMNRYEEKLSRIEMNRGSEWSSLHAKEASEKAGPGAKAAEAFALMATEAAAQAGFIDRGETEIFIRKGPIERAINAIGTGKAQDEARKLLRNMVGMAQGPINPTEGSRGISMKLVAASLRTIAEHANEQARMYASMTVPGSKEESMSETTKGGPLNAGDIHRMANELGLAISAANRKMNSRTLMTDDDDEKMSDLLAGAEQFLTEQAGLEQALRGLKNNFNELDRIYNLAKSRNLFKEASEKGTDDDGEQWDEQGWGRAVEFDEDGKPKPAARAEADEDGDTLEGIMKAARSEKANLTLSSATMQILWAARNSAKWVREGSMGAVQDAANRILLALQNEMPGSELKELMQTLDRRLAIAEARNQVSKTIMDHATDLRRDVREYLAVTGQKEADDMSEKAGFPFQKKKKPAADPNAEADPNAQPAQGQQQAPGKAPPFGKKKVPTPGQQPGMPMAEQNPQDGDQQDAEDPADIQTDAQGNQLGTNGEFAGQTVGSMTADQFGTALAAAMQPVIQAIASLNAATVQRTKEATDAAEARIANLEGEQPVMTRLERGYRASQKGPAPADAATYPMPNSAPNTEETFLNWALNGSNGARP